MFSNNFVPSATRHEDTGTSVLIPSIKRHGVLQAGSQCILLQPLELA